MQRKKKKKGSSLMIVIAVFAILSILGTSVLAMTSNDYYRRVTETKKLQNLYGAESGLDTAYNVLTKSFESAVNYGNCAVKARLETNNSGYSWEEERDIVKYNKNNPGTKQEVIYPVSATNKFESRIIDENGNLKYSEYGKVQNEIFSYHFKGFMEEVTKKSIENFQVVMISKGTPYVELGNWNYDSSIKNNVEKVDNAILTANLDMTELKVTINSKFTPNLEQERKVQADYKITMPQYSAYTESKNIAINKHPIFDKVIAVDGEMLVNNEGVTITAGTRSNIEIEGDVFVKGDSVGGLINNNDYGVANKYKGGIEIKGNVVNGIDFTINGDIVTTSSIKVKEFAKVSFVENVFASSIVLGKNSSSDTSGGNVTFNNSVVSGSSDGIYLNNDFVVNGDNIEATISNFYGINDIRKAQDAYSQEDKSIDSSSILINSRNSGTINISNRAYIWGTAYINTDKIYQTGESVAIKGNYVAYSDDLGENAQFDYYNPLQLISKIDGKDVTVDMKADHIKKYFDSNAGNLNVVGITLPSSSSIDLEATTAPTGTYAIGAYVTGGKIENDKNITPEIEDKFVNPMRNEFIDQMFYMNNSTSFGVANKSELLSQFPLGPSNEKQVNVSNSINFDKLINVDEIDGDYNRIFINNNSSKDITLTDDSKGIIITKGNVKIQGDVQFEGIIIAAGGITLQGENIVVKENPDLSMNLVAKYYEGNIKEAIENANITGNFTTQNIEVVNSMNNLDSQFQSSKYIKKGVWKIEK